LDKKKNNYIWVFISPYKIPYMKKLNLPNWRWIQHRLFLEIRSIVENDTGQSLADIIQSSLEIKKSAAYNKIRGETPLKFDEILILKEEFDIDLNDLVGK